MNRPNPTRLTIFLVLCTFSACGGAQKPVINADTVEADADAAGEARAEALRKEQERQEQLMRIASYIDVAQTGVETARTEASGVNCIQFQGSVVGYLMGPSRDAMTGNLMCKVTEDGLTCEPGTYWKGPVRLSLSQNAFVELERLQTPQAVCHPSRTSKRLWVCGARANGSGESVKAITKAGLCARF